MTKSEDRSKRLQTDFDKVYASVITNQIAIASLARNLGQADAVKSDLDNFLEKFQAGEIIREDEAPFLYSGVIRSIAHMKNLLTLSLKEDSR